MKVLVAIQDSKCTDVLGPFIASYPFPKDTAFKVMHVVHPVLVNSYMSLLPSALTETIAEERRKQGEKLARDFAEHLKEGRDPELVLSLCLEGDAKMEIVDAIEDWPADLVLLGSHGKMMGSVSRAVAAHSTCSAMIVPIHNQRDKKHPREKIHIIV
jgi:nucleotide-binding universal stress UspA family protein